MPEREDDLTHDHDGIIRKLSVMFVIDDDDRHLPGPHNVGHRLK
jgi:hypothetical protein